MNPYEVIKKPIVSEKSTDHRDQHNKYTFVVARQSTKTEIRTAIEKTFDVSVDAVRTSIVKGKRKRRGMNIGMANNWKKAVVSLAKDSKLPIFEDQ